jgi:hypothetical protein
MEDTPIDRALSWARDRGVNQSAFARLIDATPQDVTNWKRRGMPAEWHAAVAKAFGRTVDDLLGRQAHDSQPVPSEPPTTAAQPPTTLADALPVVLAHLAAGLDDYTAGQVLQALTAATRPRPPLDKIERDLLGWLISAPAAAGPVAPPEKPLRAA